VHHFLLFFPPRSINIGANGLLQDQPTLARELKGFQANFLGRNHSIPSVIQQALVLNDSAAEKHRASANTSVELYNKDRVGGVGRRAIETQFEQGFDDLRRPQRNSHHPFACAEQRHVYDICA